MEGDTEGGLGRIWFQQSLNDMGFFTALTEAMASRQSLLVTGLDPNPEMLRSWAASRSLGGGSLLSQARAWCKSVIEATSDHVCAYKPSLGFYQAMGSAGVDLLMDCLLYTSPSPRDGLLSRMPSSA